MRWREVDQRTNAALARVLLEWNGTPYREGGDVKRVAVDCVRFVGRVLDELRGNGRTPIVTLRGEAAQHSMARACAILETLAGSYQPVEIVRDGTLEPGDVVVLSYGGGPTHTAIAGPRRNTLWEATAPAVRVVGVSALERPDTQIFRVYRPSDKADWK